MSTPTAKITEFKLGKGLSTSSGKDGPWTKLYFELTVKLPEQPTSEEEFAAALVRAEYVIDNYLGQPAAAPAAPQIPEFDSQLLMNHEWKGKKTGDGQYAKGSNSWGWDFADKLPKEVIAVLEKGPLQIDKYEFTLEGPLVHAGQAGKKKK
jgi:hypothetical protein